MLQENAKRVETRKQKYSGVRSTIFAFVILIFVLTGCSSQNKVVKKDLNIDQKYIDKLTSDPDYKDWNEIKTKYDGLKSKKKDVLDFCYFLIEMDKKWDAVGQNILNNKIKYVKEKWNAEWRGPEWNKEIVLASFIKLFKKRIFSTIIFKDSLLPINNANVFAVNVLGMVTYIEHKRVSSWRGEIYEEGEGYRFETYSDKDERKRRILNWMPLGNSVFIITKNKIDDPEDYRGASWDDAEINSIGIFIGHESRVNLSTSNAGERLSDITRKKAQKTIKRLTRELTDPIWFGTALFQAFGKNNEIEIKEKFKEISNASKEHLIEMTKDEYSEEDVDFFKRYNTEFVVDDNWIKVSWDMDGVFITFRHKNNNELDDAVAKLVDDF